MIDNSYLLKENICSGGSRISQKERQPQSGAYPVFGIIFAENGMKKK